MGVFRQWHKNKIKIYNKYKYIYKDRRENKKYPKIKGFDRTSSSNQERESGQWNLNSLTDAVLKKIVGESLDYESVSKGCWGFDLQLPRPIRREVKTIDIP